MAVLYQKYRPLRFAEVIGQDGVIRTLLNASKAGELAHAYLFTGSRGVGKTTLARLVAKAANCQNLKDGDPCGVCDICSAIAAGNFLDVVEIDAASHTGVDNIRELIEHVQFRPSQGKFKVFIIDEVHMLSKAAFNALLKTLEEPPAHVIFILATTDIEKVPETIISRTQRFDFRKITPEVMRVAIEKIAKKEKIHLPEGALELIIVNSEGAMRDALSLLGTISALGGKATSEEVRTLLGFTTITAIEELMGHIVTAEPTKIPDFFEAQNSQGIDFAVFNRNVLEYLRLMLVYKVTAQSGVTGILDAKQFETLTGLTNQLNIQQLLFVIRLFLRSYKEINQAPLPDLPMLMSAIEASVYFSGNSPQTITQSSTQTKPAPSPVIKSSSKEEPQVNQAVIETPQQNIAETTTPDSDVTKQEVLVWWPEVIQHIKTVNSPLATLLKNSPLQDVSKGIILIEVRYLFHKENLENTKHLALILETINRISGKHLQFRCVIVKDSQAETIPETAELLTDAIKIFGGELVE